MGQGMSETWTDAKVEQLTKLWAEGFSFSAIGEQLGLNRNQVCGKINRLQLPEPEKKMNNPRGVSHVVRKRRVETRQKTLYELFVPRSADDLADKSLNVSFDDIDRATQCVFPFGDGPFVFCGHPKAEGSSYCEGHHLICWEPARRDYQKRPTFSVWA